MASSIDRGSDNVESNAGATNEENDQSNEDAGVISVNRGEGEAIQTVEGSRKQHAKRDHKRADVVR